MQEICELLSYCLEDTVQIMARAKGLEVETKRANFDRWERFVPNCRFYLYVYYLYVYRIFIYQQAQIRVIITLLREYGFGIKYLSRYVFNETLEEWYNLISFI